MKLYVPGRLYFLQNKPDLRWAMQSYEDGSLNDILVNTLLLISLGHCSHCDIRIIV